MQMKNMSQASPDKNADEKHESGIARQQTYYEAHNMLV
jgi:hypothetical protein